MKKFLVLLMMFLMIASNCFAIGNVVNSDEILYEMYSNPQNFICIGSGGTGYIIYLDKSSVNVCEYNPPHYLIKFRTIGLSYAPKKEGLTYGPKGERAVRDFYRYYYYNYNTRRMYEKIYDSNGNSNKEEYINESTYEKWTNSNKPWLNGGEVAFYLAYKMNFYGKPISITLKSYLKNGTWSTFGSE